MAMKLDRRTVLKLGLAATAGASPGLVAAGESEAPKETRPSSPDYVGVLVDTTLCIGCRKCEEACNRRNHLPRTAESFSDRDVLRSFRRPTDTAFTVVNQFPGSPSPDQAGVPRTYCKVQCMHCLYPSCVSACIVGALTKLSDGAVVYNPTICIGCRYCQVACPFEIPAYEFHEPLLPRVRKCEFCADRTKGTGADPACAASCPTEALVFGRRADLVALAKDRLKRRPDRYVNHIYGETEVGGTSWLYLTGRPVHDVGLLNLPETPPPQLTEAIQHGIFKYGIIPVAFYGLLAGLMWVNHRKHPDDDAPAGEAHDTPSAQKPEGGGQ
jgi:formate dehydrogenase iron-sulfur subunit